MNQTNFDTIDKSLNIFGESIPFGSQCVKMSADEIKSSESISRRGSRVHAYPWLSCEIGEAFFKPMSLEDLRKDKGRPTVPLSLKSQGYKFRITRIKNHVRKIHGYMSLLLK